MLPTTYSIMFILWYVGGSMLVLYEFDVASDIIYYLYALFISLCKHIQPNTQGTQEPTKPTNFAIACIANSSQVLVVVCEIRVCVATLLKYEHGWWRWRRWYACECEWTESVKLSININNNNTTAKSKITYIMQFSSPIHHLMQMQFNSNMLYAMFAQPSLSRSFRPSLATA